VSVGGRPVELTSREFTLLETFLRHPDQVLSRAQLLSRVWGFAFDPTSNVVNVFVATLRQKIGNGRIETVRGAGYRLRAAVASPPEQIRSDQAGREPPRPAVTRRLM
jgi:DNA-binding response OmpR family regulator